MVTYILICSSATVCPEVNKKKNETNQIFESGPSNLRQKCLFINRGLRSTAAQQTAPSFITTNFTIVPISPDHFSKSIFLV